MTSHYREQSRSHLQSAKDELGANSDGRLKFASLELRMAMECLTYDRALSYKDEFPPSEYDTWQPKRVMMVLLEIEPTADKDSSLSFGIEETPGVPSLNMHAMGTEKVLSMSVLKKHYDALGSFLHVQSIKHARDGVIPDFAKIRSRCGEIAKFIDEVLASSIFNVNIGNFAVMNCEKCGKPVRKRMVAGVKEVNAECYSDGCVASYTIRDDGDDRVTWFSHKREFKCANPDCEEKTLKWSRELELGHRWECNGCKGRTEVGLCLNWLGQAERED